MKNENHTQCHHTYPLAPIHTKKRLPVDVDEFDRIDKAFYREKQIEGWSRKKKEALIQGMPEKLHESRRCVIQKFESRWFLRSATERVWFRSTTNF